MEVIHASSWLDVSDDFTGIAIITSQESMVWYKNGKVHREDGPAIIWLNGSLYWYYEGAQHRSDGPAVMNVNGLRKWFIKGKEYASQSEWFNVLTSEQKENALWSMGL